MKLSSRENATTIAALRLFQEMQKEDPILSRIYDYISSYSYFRKIKPLDEKEIDSLCAKLGVFRRK